MTAVGVIPARWGSTRFPGKILCDLCGKPLVQWVMERAAQAGRLADILVATDDQRIFETVLRLGGHPVMTRSDHPSGTDRVAEAIAGRDADIVVNIQGDEPLIDPGLLDRLVDRLEEDPARWDMATAATPIRDERLMTNPSVVKVVCDAQGEALYFSRATIPFVRDREPDDGQRPLHWRHLGVYAYRRPFLERLVRTPGCPLERAEKLEQLRALHIGGRIAVLETNDFGIGVDTPEDVPYVAAVIREQGLAPC